jgi:hypothetical protein
LKTLSDEQYAEWAKSLKPGDTVAIMRFDTVHGLGKVTKVTPAGRVFIGNDGYMFKKWGHCVLERFGAPDWSSDKWKNLAPCTEELQAQMAQQARDKLEKRKSGDIRRALCLWNTWNSVQYATMLEVAKLIGMELPADDVEPGCQGPAKETSKP